MSLLDKLIVGGSSRGAAVVESLGDYGPQSTLVVGPCQRKSILTRKSIISFRHAVLDDEPRGVEAQQVNVTT